MDQILFKSHFELSHILKLCHCHCHFKKWLPKPEQNKNKKQQAKVD